jgi:hypothetical protein
MLNEHLNEHFLVLLLFRIFNFGLLIALGCFLYRRYIKQSTEQTIQDQETLAKGMEELSYMLEGQLMELDEDLLRQQRLCDFLKNRVLEWQTEVYEQREKISAYRTQCVSRINAHIHARSQKVAEMSHLRVMIPKAFAVADSTLRQEFSRPERHAKFMQELSQRMSKI